MKADAIYFKLRAEIDAGKYSDGDLLKGETELAREYGVARGTIRNVLQRLASDGYLQVVRGKKRTVRRPPPWVLVKPDVLMDDAEHPAMPDPPEPRSPSFGQYLMDENHHPHDEVLRAPKTVSVLDVAGDSPFDIQDVLDRLRLSSSDQVIWFLRLRHANQQPIALQWCLIPANLYRGQKPMAVGFDDLVPGGLTKVYNRFGIDRCSAKAIYEPTRPSASDASLLAVSVDSALIKERRVSYFFPPNEKRSRPYEYLITLYNQRVRLEFDWLTPVIKSGEDSGTPRRRGNGGRLPKKPSSDKRSPRRDNHKKPLHAKRTKPPKAKESEK